MCLFVYLIVCLFDCLFVCLFVCLFFSPSVVSRSGESCNGGMKKFDKEKEKERKKKEEARLKNRSKGLKAFKVRL